MSEKEKLWIDGMDEDWTRQTWRWWMWTDTDEELYDVLDDWEFEDTDLDDKLGMIFNNNEDLESVRNFLRNLAWIFEKNWVSLSGLYDDIDEKLIRKIIDVYRWWVNSDDEIKEIFQKLKEYVSLKNKNLSK